MKSLDSFDSAAFGILLSRSLVLSKVFSVAALVYIILRLFPVLVPTE